MKLKRRINPEVVRKLKDAVFVGRLANENDFSGTPLGDPVYFKDEFQENIQFHIKCLSPIPEDVSKQFYFPNNIITGSTISNNNYRKLSEWMDYDRLHHFEKKEEVRNFLENKLIAFTFNVRTEIVYVELLQYENVLPSEQGYLMIPGPKLKLDEDKSDFENKMVDIRKPFILQHYPHIFELPEFIYFRGTIYQVSLNPSLNATTYSQKESEEVTYDSSIDDIFIDAVDMRIEDYLYFVQKDKILDIRDRVEEHGLSLSAKFELEKAREERIDQENSLVNEQSETTLASNVQVKYNKDEINFIKHLKDNARKRGLYFNDHDLYAFHISAKTNLLSIIGGMSGTGKSQLAKLYGETMGLQYGKELLMIPVSPSYHEPNDVLGYLNPTTGVYHESETGLVSLLLEAEESPERMFMVIFDEMNLSQVEHWFSPFISLLEIEEDDRYLTLFNENSYCVNNKYKAKVKIGNNIIFVGTVNFDETTKDFSDRLLDRTNVIVPTKLSFKQSLDILRSQSSDIDQIDTLNIHTSIFRDDWVNTKQQNNSLSVLTESEITLLDEIHSILHEGDRQKGVSFRVALGISNFLANIPATEEEDLIIDRSVAFDMQLSQRILTKINGIASYVRPIVGHYENGEYILGSMANLLESAIGKKVSNFDISLNHLKSKAKELMLYGYAK